MTDTIFNNKLPWRWVGAEMQAQFKAHAGELSFLASPANETWIVVSPIWDHNTIYRAVPIPEPALTQDTINWKDVNVGFTQLVRGPVGRARLVWGDAPYHAYVYADFHAYADVVASYIRGSAPSSISWRPGHEPKGKK